MDIAARQARIADLEKKMEQAKTWKWMAQYVPNMKIEHAVHTAFIAEENHGTRSDQGTAAANATV